MPRFMFFSQSSQQHLHIVRADRGGIDGTALEEYLSFRP